MPGGENQGEENASAVADLLQRSQNSLVGVRPAADVLLAGVNVITVHVDHVPIARADKLWRGSLLQLLKE